MVRIQNLLKRALAHEGSLKIQLKIIDLRKRALFFWKMRKAAFILRSKLSFLQKSQFPLRLAVIYKMASLTLKPTDYTELLA